MKVNKKIFDCKNSTFSTNNKRSFFSIKCSICSGSEEYERLLRDAAELSEVTSDYMAVDSQFNRKQNRKLIDSVCGVFSELAWLKFLEFLFGDNISVSEFEDASTQIDILINNQKKIEVRSSNVRKGAEFGLCSDRYNFKNIGPYANDVKPGEIQKDYYSGALFPHNKNDILNLDELTCYLVGSSTWEMMVKGESSFQSMLRPQNTNVNRPGMYHVIRYRDTMDVKQFVKYLIKEEKLEVENKFGKSMELPIYDS